MSPASSRVITPLGTLAPGTHLCAFHRDEAQLTRIAATFIGQGLAAGDQLLYVTSDGDAEPLLTALPEHLDARGALASGQLLLSSFADAYGTRLPDNLDGVADGFRAAAAQSRKDGFPWLRVAAQMDGLAPLLGSLDDVVRWEEMCTGLQRELGVSSVCLYDASVLEANHRAQLARAHAGLAPEVADLPLASFLALDEPWGLRISGELDISNRDRLQQALASRAAVTPQVHLDLGGLTFVDAGALVRIRAVAASLPECGWLALHRVPDVVRRALSVLGIHHERLRLEP